MLALVPSVNDQSFLKLTLPKRGARPSGHPIWQTTQVAYRK